MRGLALLICSVFLLVEGGLCTVWEFGQDTKKSIVISTSNGDMTIFEKIRRVQFTVPPCYKVVYVRVEVHNELTTPAVTFNRDINTVVIYYKLLQSSHCSYNVVVKAVPICGKKQQGNKGNNFHPIVTDTHNDYYDSDEFDYRSKNPMSGKANDLFLAYQLFPGIEFQGLPI